MRTAAFAALLVAAACRGDGRAPDRAPAHPAPGPGPTTATGSAQPAGSGAGENAGSAGGNPGSAGTNLTNDVPAGDDKLVAVPKDVAATVKLEKIAHGLKRPVLLTVAPNDARRRLFILEQHKGTVRILENGKLLEKPFLTISGLSTGNEQGLLGLAFHPKYATTGKLYVHYTAKDDSSHIVEYKVSATNADEADPASRRELVMIEQPYSNHNGGHLEFGPDGKLYTGMGDGGAANDPQRNGQNPKTLLSKILRFDVDAADAKPEIVHMGLRNPWRFSFDAKTGDLFIGDVGQNLWEYVYAVRGGDTRKHNFGWNILEGSHCFDADTGGGKKSCNKTGFTLPVAEYSHDDGCSITGGVVYRGKALPQLAGRYFYADYCTGLLRSFVFNGGVVREHWNWKRAIDKNGDLSQISSFGVDHDGEVYIVSLLGSIFRLAPAS